MLSRGPPGTIPIRCGRKPPNHYNCSHAVVTKVLFFGESYLGARSAGIRQVSSRASPTMSQRASAFAFMSAPRYRPSDRLLHFLDALLGLALCRMERRTTLYWHIGGRNCAGTNPTATCATCWSACRLSRQVDSRNCCLTTGSPCRPKPSASTPRIHCQSGDARVPTVAMPLRAELVA
jgi:hypothetical protein